MKNTVLSLLTIIIVMALGIVCSAASKKPVTLFMVGDSTMADKEELDASPERGWGQLFPTYLQGNIVVQNHARNGRSTKSFLAEGRWAEVMKRAQRNDIVLIQFGHNDTKQDDPNRYASIEDYEKNLMTMIEQAQKKHLKVILCTPIARRYFKDGVFHPRHGGYPEAARRVAKRMNVPLLDLEASSNEWVKSMGDDMSKQYFMNVAPGECTKFPDGKTDNTHLREAGALAIGRQAAEMIVNQKIKFLSKYIRMDGPTVYTTPCGVKY